MDRFSILKGLPQPSPRPSSTPRYMLRNGIIVKKRAPYDTGNAGWVEVVSIPCQYKDKNGQNWIIGENHCLTSDYKGEGNWGEEYDLIPFPVPDHIEED